MKKLLFVVVLLLAGCVYYPYTDDFYYPYTGYSYYNPYPAYYASSLSWYGYPSLSLGYSYPYYRNYYGYYRSYPGYRHNWSGHHGYYPTYRHYHSGHYGTGASRVWQGHGGGRHR